ncbi:MAG: hypothetical protein EZS28_050160, partial [Streblomastix strix]
WEYIFELINHGECGFPKHASTRFTCWNRRDTRQWDRARLGVLITQCGEGGLLTHRAKRRAGTRCPNFGSYYRRGNICSALSGILQNQETKRSHPREWEARQHDSCKYGT